MAKGNIENIIQALLFTTDKPLPVSVIAGAAEAEAKDVESAVDRINIRLKENGSPIMIKQVAGGYEYLTLPEYAPYIKKLYKNRFLTKLSKPAMEVLSIIAYKQPVTKQEVELIRGVNSDGVYHTLLERKMVKISGRKESPGRPLLYGTTREFMQYLGINSLEDLPKLDEIKSILDKEENTENWDDRIEKARSQTLFNFDEEGLSVAKRFSEQKEADKMEGMENAAGSEPAETDDAGKKRWQEEYEEQYGEKEEDAYKRDEKEEELKDEDEEDEDAEASEDQINEMSGDELVDLATGYLTELGLSKKELAVLGTGDLRKKLIALVNKDEEEEGEEDEDEDEDEEDDEEESYEDKHDLEDEEDEKDK